MVITDSDTLFGRKPTRTLHNNLVGTGRVYVLSAYRWGTHKGLRYTSPYWAGNRDRWPKTRTQRTPPKGSVQYRIIVKPKRKLDQ